jgi:hypothetical protein
MDPYGNPDHDDYCTNHLKCCNGLTGNREWDTRDPESFAFSLGKSALLPSCTVGSVGPVRGSFGVVDRQGKMMTHPYRHNTLHEPRIASQKRQPERIRVIHLQLLFDNLSFFFMIRGGHHLIYSVCSFCFRQLRISWYSWLGTT